MSIDEKREQMLSMIADWQQSGKTKKRYCEEYGISPATFYYWFSRTKEQDAARGGFIAIDSTFRDTDIELIYPNGVRLKVRNDLSLLSRLIRMY